jgi:predicted enzyme related to lactoylglutathione lyase
MPGQIVHFEIPADDTTKGREFWGSLFGWQFEAWAQAVTARLLLRAKSGSLFETAARATNEK